ncbi:MAG: hypothetical protein QOI12_943 [Alphaproteobacteria bacterium]|nr:hypothetical protein [Alphaproteobacteria bacterium]
MENDLDLRCMNHNPLDLTADYVSKAMIINVAGTVRWRLLL